MRNLSASVRQHLLNYSKAQKLETNLVFARFAAERLLYRLAQSPYAERFVLKGAMLLPNSRMKDFFDLWVLSERCAFDGEELAAAVRATFSRRGSPIPEQTPVALTEEFARHADKERQWSAFVSKGELHPAPKEFARVIAQLGGLLEPVLESLRMNRPFARDWPPGGPWQSAAT
jgi:hypothetical protein